MDASNGRSNLDLNIAWEGCSFKTAWLLALGDLLCGFAKTGPQLYVFRGITGVGTGGIMALAMMIVSDVVTLENRGKYQGILGSCIGLGNTIGPFLAAAFVQDSTWRGLFWCICPLAVLSGVMVAWTLPPSKVHGSTATKIRVIDYPGIVLITAAMLILIPLSGGGTYFKWSSPMVISMLTLGGCCLIGFLIVEWKFAAMPMMPLHLFKNPAVAAILAQNFLFVGFKETILASMLSVPNLATLTSDQKNEVLNAYMAASKSVFYLWVPIIGVCLCFCVLVKDKGLQRPDEKPIARESEQEEEVSGSVTGSDIAVDERGTRREI
ncbi:hypothetical protein DID88_008110 [Monilinia fructigena]|uniref:Major facilitator superfamily (MFS) profile domain-containing protein n=1 Tax=Monilinia fructigena TaxID=38457 RepID=A0A395J6R9_9HELO|nr:hypothetical protein DID88_008110 [Monilinia fructigena]